jgi:MoxR-like ATPase
MTKTLLTRISKLDQYNDTDKTVLWEDPAENRWHNVYGKLKVNDNAIFIASKKLLIGTISEINKHQSIQCSNVQEVTCSNDQFLQLHEIYPELVSRVKASFQPFIHPQEVNISQLIEDAVAERFVSYYILSDGKYNELKGSFKVNDRIVIINSNKQLSNVKLYTVAGLANFPAISEVNISVEDLTLDEVLKKNESIKRKSAKSYNVDRIKKIQTDIATNGYFKFNTFFTYYDALYNKRAYGNSASTDNSILKIPLQPNETVYKVSMSSKDITEAEFTFCNEKNLIIVHGDAAALGTSRQTQGDTFAKQMKEGDYFYLCRGNENLEVIGKIIGQAEECEYGSIGDDGWLQRPYEVISEAINGNSYKDDQNWWTPNARTTCSAIPKGKIKDANTKLFIPFFNAQFEYEENTPTTRNISKPMNQPLNQILFGPPGTGKTYNTINKALEIIGENIEGKSRSEIKKIFDAKMQEGQIVFTTFHQSMSYEDFIEGIKPETISGNVTYNVRNGIFKNLCLAAKTPNQLDFNSAYEQLKKDLSDKEMISIKTPTGKEFSISLNSNGNLTLHTGINKEKQGTLTQENIQKQINGEDKFIGWEGYFKGVVTYLETQYKYSSKPQSDIQNFVLIIDEINRGNVSQIFGELITLIEDDKRLGKDEALEVTLPYSKEKFGVPSNLYIIGTMNTADRSVEALDAALRRRFSFKEMPPKPELIATEGKLEAENGFLGNIELPVVLKTINTRIEQLLDKDHQIGHSYFMSVSSVEDLKLAFQNKIIPLLQEYFFGDYGKVGLVLGQGFVELVRTSNENIFSNFDDDSASEFSERASYKIKKFSDKDDDFMTAINSLLLTN